MCLCILRRGFLQASLLSPALLACTPREQLSHMPSVPTGTRWIDVHCHVFNGRDLPIYQFINRTRLNYPDPQDRLALVLVAILAGGIQHDSPSIEAENAALDAASGFIAAAGDVEAPDPARGLQRLRDRAVTQSNGFVPASADEQPGMDAPSGTEMAQLLDRALRAASIRRPGRYPGKPKVPSDRELDLLTQLLQGNDVTGTVPRSGLIAATASSGESVGSLASRYFNWGLSFGHSRDSLVGQLRSLYPAESQVMLTPAMVDYDAWLGAPDTRPAGQAGTMARIALRRARQGMPVHAFAAFDPWRHLIERPRVDTLDELFSVLDRGAAIGVKLYPPMGFAPAGNSGRDQAQFPFPPDLVRLTGGQPGRELDAVLDRLFDHCAERGIPVMAHCGPTNSPTKNAEYLASPSFWRTALAANRPHRRELRLNLGHFGGVWDLDAGQKTQRDWALEIVALMREYPNVYADIGYFGSVLYPTSQAGVIRATVDFIEAAANAPGSTVRRRLMYGSDWSMLGQESSVATYPVAAVTALAPVWVGEQQQDLRWRNAARFLGLAAPDDTLKRLLAFYKAGGVDPAPLLRFDPAS